MELCVCVCDRVQSCCARCATCDSQSSVIAGVENSGRTASMKTNVPWSVFITVFVTFVCGRFGPTT